MALNINTNIGALGAAAAATSVNKSMETAMERLSTGLRINTAADDAAGTAITSRMEANIRGLNQAIRNAGDGQALIDTAEGAHIEIENILQRMRELAVQSANDTNSASDRASLNDEVNQLIAEIDRIASQTTWAGMKVLDGSYVGKSLQVGAFGSETIDVSIDSVASGSLGAFVANSLSHIMEGTDVADAETRTDTALTLTGPVNSASITFADDSSAKTIAAAVNAETATTGISATARTNLMLESLSHAGTVSFTLTGTGSASISANVSTVSDLRNVRDAINAVAGSTGISATMYTGDNSKLLLTSATGEDIKLVNFASSGDAASTIDAFAADYDGTALAQTNTLTRAADDSVTAVGQVRFSASGSFTVVGTSTAGAGTGYMAAVSTPAEQSAVSAIRINTQANATSAINVIDGALLQIADQRGSLGAISNRLDNTISNLTNVSTNTSAAQSRIQDADFAAESTNLAKAQILQQASMAMLAQANASKQGVLQLLQG